MKKIIMPCLFILVLMTLFGCSKKDTPQTGSDFVFSDKSEPTPELTPTSTPTPTPDLTNTPVPTAPSATPTESYAEIIDENGIVSDMCDIDSDYNFLQFNNCDELYAQLPMYAFNILRDSTNSYLIQCGLADAKTFTYIDGSLEITNTHVSFTCSIEEYPEYNLYFDYSINDSCYNYAVIIK